MDTKQKHTHGLRKFLVLVSIVLGYALFVTIKFGVADGLSATALTWAFFVTCTPIADAGFLLDFPIRLLFGVRMLISEIIVWALALMIIAGYTIFSPEIFTTLGVLEMLQNIIKSPPLWSIVLVSGIGTFMSIHIGDQIFTMIEERRHHKHIQHLQIKRLWVEIVAFCVVLVLYFVLLGLTNTVIGWPVN